MAIQKLDEKHMAFTVGSFAAILKIVWALIVFAGSGNAMMGWVWGMHFMRMPFEVMPFSGFAALVMVVVTFIIGAIIGWLFAKVWNFWATQKYFKI